jgi:hypothetical protein
MSDPYAFGCFASRGAVQWKLIVADGYHCLCAVYSFDEDAVILCQII